MFKGTNHGTKLYSAAIQPTMNLSTSANAMNIQADLKAAQLEDIVMRDFEKPIKNWSKTSTSQYVTSFAEGLLKSITERVHMYSSRRVGESTFHVEFIGDSTSSTEELRNIPHETVTEEEHQPSDDRNMTIQYNDVSNSDLSNVPIPLFNRI